MWLCLKCLSVESLYVALRCSFRINQPFDDGVLKDTGTLKWSFPIPPLPCWFSLCLYPQTTASYIFLLLRALSRCTHPCIEISGREKANPWEARGETPETQRTQREACKAFHTQEYTIDTARKPTKAIVAQQICHLRHNTWISRPTSCKISTPTNKSPTRVVFLIEVFQGGFFFLMTSLTWSQLWLCRPHIFVK